MPLRVFSFRLFQCPFFLALILCWSAATLTLRAAEGTGKALLTNAFFAMDTGTKDAKHATPAAQAALLKDLGYAGIGWSPGQVPEMLAALDQHGLKMFTVYTGLELGTGNTQYLDSTQQLIDQLKGRDTILWLYITNKKQNPSAEDGDAEAVAALRELANRAQAARVRLSLYPHTWLWLERVQDAVRVARKVNHPNVGVTFNLCHCLRVGDEPRIPELLAAAKPYLSVVTINGADHAGDWDRLIQTLDRGSFDLAGFLKQLHRIDYRGPIGLQGYGIKGDVHENLARSIQAWQRLTNAVAQGTSAR